MNAELNNADIAFLLISSGLVLLMTPGVSFFYGGMVKKKNLVSTMAQSFVCLAVISLVWFAFGFSLSFGSSFNGLIGNPFTYAFFKNVGLEPNPLYAGTIPFLLYALFQMKFAIITPALVTGAFAERIHFRAYLAFVVLFSIFIYAPVAHWTWHPEGFLRKWGVLDFAGGTVVHITAGMASLAAAILFRKRHEQEMRYSSVPFILLGGALLWFGWFGFNGGSALASNPSAVKAIMNTHLASSAAMIVWMILDYLKNRKVSAVGACIGAIVGLVAITPAGSLVSLGASVVIGSIGAMVSFFAVSFRSKTGLDDTLDVFPCHGMGGITGMILTAVFAEEGGLLNGGGLRLLLIHLLGLLIVVGYSFGVSFLIYRFIKAVLPLEVTVEEEKVGLDFTQHGEVAEFWDGVDRRSPGATGNPHL
jgi:Amt family ammonium transporter